MLELRKKDSGEQNNGILSLIDLFVINYQNLSCARLLPEKHLKHQQANKFFQRCEMDQDNYICSSRLTQLQLQVLGFIKLCAVKYQYFFYNLSSVKIPEKNKEKK
ncbi:Hypothetical_protein [Hexamita inflata]|uniref:Hypothetical_protein n=1 Tax=Hexamita inflata TaxID=28002 RepID=A0AA86N4G3_9EUKA|nr:Hypothetical protein HINF_LOCUS170 [Hexamita inflata]CAI9912528.1 Hypothetical protein HINF_LOCUS173 [Hexamita inflata]